METIREKIFDLLGFKYDGIIEKEEYDGVKVVWDGEKAVIGCKDKVTYSRGLFRFACEYKETPFVIEEKQRLELLSVLIDVSRNGVLKVETVKKYIEYIAALGFTHFSLYMEDIYEMKEYPHFGYMRGRYSTEELKEIKNYADIFGIKILPGIETLGHMGQYLKWEEADPIKDTSEVLLVDEPKTYEFIENQVKHMREISDSKYLRICMDEAWDLGTGNFAKKHGYELKTSIFKRHAAKVYKICEKYGFKPIIDSDMFYCNNSEEGLYYDKNVRISEKMLDGFPENVVIDYWDYYHTDEEDYDFFIKEHKKFNRELLITGSVWTWEGFTEDTEFTLQTSIPLMRQILKHDVKNLTVSMWGDDGAETNPIYSAGTLAIFSEYCYRGKDCSLEEIDEVSEKLTGLSVSKKTELSRIHCNMHNESKIFKRILYTDLFYNLADVMYDYEKVTNDWKTGLLKAEEYMRLNDKYYDYFKYCRAMFDAVLKKIELLHFIKDKYHKQDKEYLRDAADRKIPELTEALKLLHSEFKKDWLKYKKPNGIEVMNLRFGGIISQLEYQRERLNAYLNGEIDTIEELDEKTIITGRKTLRWNKQVVTPSIII